MNSTKIGSMNKFHAMQRNKLSPRWSFKTELVLLRKGSYVLFSRHRSSRAESYKTVEDIPGPKPSLPFAGTSWIYSYFGPYSKDSMITSAREDLLSKFGPIYKEKMGGANIVSLHSPEHIETVMRRQGEIPMRVLNEANIYWRSKRPDLYNTVGLVDSIGDEWYSLRHKVSPSVLKPIAASSFVESISTIADNFVYAIRDGKNKTRHEVEDAREYLFRFGLEAIWKMTLGFEIGALKANQPYEAKLLVSLSKDLFESFASLSLSRPWWKLWNTPTFRRFCKAEEDIFRIVNGYSQTAIEQNRDKEKEESLLENTILKRFLAVKDFHVKDVNTVIIDFIAAGIPTTAYFLTLLLHRLGQEKIIQRRLQTELDAAIKDKNDTITPSILNSLPLLRAVIQEGFRLTSIIPAIMRLLPQEITCDEYKIPAYTPILCQTRAASLSKKYFLSPTQFIPDRWLRNIADESFIEHQKEAKSRHFLVLPFGYGPRMCVGRRLAEKEITVLLAKIFLNFTIESEGEIELVNHFIVGPKNPVRLYFTERNCC